MANKKNDAFGDIGDIYKILAGGFNAGYKAASGAGKNTKNSESKGGAKAPVEDFLSGDFLKDLGISEEVLKDTAKLFTDIYKDTAKEANKYTEKKATKNKVEKAEPVKTEPFKPAAPVKATEQTSLSSKYPSCVDIVKISESGQIKIDSQICFLDKKHDFRYFEDGELYGPNTEVFKDHVPSCEVIRDLQQNHHIKLQDQVCYYDTTKSLYNYHDGDFTEVKVENSDHAEL